MDAAERVIARVQKADAPGAREPELYATARELHREVRRFARSSLSLSRALSLSLAAAPSRLARARSSIGS